MTLSWIGRFAFFLLPSALRASRNLPLFSYETFRKKFKSRYGVSPHQYRQRCLMQRACTLLLNRRLSVKQTAAVLGFCDEFHFSRLFKKVTGRPPSALITGSLNS
jgi:AraC-like DNA-binding protein